MSQTPAEQPVEATPVADEVAAEQPVTTQAEPTPGEVHAETAAAQAPAPVDVIDSNPDVIPDRSVAEGVTVFFGADPENRHEYPVATDFVLNEDGSLAVLSGDELIAEWLPGTFNHVDKA